MGPSLPTKKLTEAEPTYRAKIAIDRELQQAKFNKWQNISNCNWLIEQVGAKIDMYPTRADKQKEIADSICVGCPAQYDCLVLALTAGEEHGVWGGTTEADRKILLDEITELHKDIPKNLWSVDLGNTISQMAVSVVETSLRDNGLEDYDPTEVVEERKNVLKGAVSKD